MKIKEISVEICKRDGSPQDASRNVIFIPTAGSSMSPHSK
jgi:hypothetical protein